MTKITPTQAYSAMILNGIGLVVLLGAVFYNWHIICQKKKVAKKTMAIWIVIGILFVAAAEFIIRN
jgi:hypothetical protein